MRSRIGVLVAVLGMAALLSPRQARAQISTCPNTFGVCADFTLAQTATGWQLTTDYVSSPSGVLTATGIYYNAGSTPPSFGISGVTIVSPVVGWGTNCTDLNMNSGSTSLLSACGGTTNGVNDAVSPGGQVVITFNANSTFATAFAAGQFDYRAHIQAYGPTGCSIKLDTGAPGNVGSTGCMSAVPEPAALLLLGTGLFGLGGVQWRRRRRMASA